MSLILVDSPNMSEASLSCYQGDTFTRTFTLHTNASGNIAAINIAGYFVAATVKRVRGGAVETLHESNTVNGDVAVSGAESNVVTWTMNTTVTNALPSASLVYDLRISNASARSTYLSGQFVVEREVKE